jgi:hypothetical protein
MNCPDQTIIGLVINHYGNPPSLHVPLGPFREQNLPEEKALSTDVTLTDSQETDLGPVPGLDKRNNPAPLAGTLSWESSDQSILAVTDKGDGTATAAAAGPLGNAQVKVTDGVGTAVINFTVIAGGETQLAVPVGTPREQA